MFANACILKHSLILSSIPRARNATVVQVFLGLMFSPLFLRNVESGFGDFVGTHLKAPLDCL